MNAVRHEGLGWEADLAAHVSNHTNFALLYCIIIFTKQDPCKVTLTFPISPQDLPLGIGWFDSLALLQERSKMPRLTKVSKTI